MNRDLLLWFDLETTGLDEQTDIILEVGWGITDTDLEWVIEPKSTIVLPSNLHIRLDDDGQIAEVTLKDLPVHPVVVSMHVESGLWDEMLRKHDDLVRYGPTLADVEADIIQEINRLRDNGRVTLAGTGVSQFDMRWIKHYMPRLHNILTYYCIDIGTYERVQSLFRTGDFRGSSTSAVHRSKSDILYAHMLAERLREAEHANG